MENIMMKEINPVHHARFPVGSAAGLASKKIKNIDWESKIPRGLPRGASIYLSESGSGLCISGFKFGIIQRWILI
jgi:hypothetical protein